MTCPRAMWQQFKFVVPHRSKILFPPPHNAPLRSSQCSVSRCQVNRILYVRNLPYKISADELYDIFGKYGSLRQIRRGTRLVGVSDTHSPATLLSGAQSSFSVEARHRAMTHPPHAFCGKDTEHDVVRFPSWGLSRQQLSGGRSKLESLSFRVIWEPFMSRSVNLILSFDHPCPSRMSGAAAQVGGGRGRTRGFLNLHWWDVPSRQGLRLGL